MTTSASSVGRLRTGTSGFSYRAWSPVFYPADARRDGLLSAYAARLPACELNNTFYRRPSPERLRAWRTAVPDDFRFVVKAQRGAAMRAMRGDARESVAWVTEGLGELGPCLGAVLFRVPAEMPRDDTRLDGLLAAWPSTIPLVVEFQDRSWHVDETFEALRAAGAVLCATDLDGLPAPDLRVTGPFLYARLRRSAYDAADRETWAARLAPFLASGLDAYAFLRHDETGHSAVTAEGLARSTERRLLVEA